MKKVMILFCLLLTVTTIMAKKEKTKLSLRQQVAALKWVSPEKTGVEIIDNFYEKGDSLYKHITELSDGLTFYDVKIVANESGDTIVSVVDEEGNLRSGWGATKQYIQTGLYTGILASDCASSIKSGGEIVKNVKSFFTGNPFKAISLAAATSKAVKMITNLANTGTALVNEYTAQRKKIRKYVKATTTVTDLSDPTLRNIPGVELDENAVITKSDQEFLDGLNRMKAEDSSLKSDSDILKELNELD